MFPKKSLSINIQWKFDPFNLNIWFVIFFLLIPFSQIAFSDTNKNTFTVASYNVENLFDLEDNGSEYKEYKPFTHDWNLNSYHQKLENISNVIKALNADIVVLSEIENQNILNTLIKELKLKSCRYKWSAIGNTPLKNATSVALLSKFPIKKSTSYATHQENNKTTRNLLETDILIGKDKLKIFAVHWPSKRHPESSRVEACKTLISRIIQLPKLCDYLIVGDMNSNYNEAETFFTSGHDNTNGVTAINHKLNTIISSPNEPICFYKPGTKNTKDFMLYNPWIEVPYSKRYSYIYKGAKNTLDHILISNNLFDSSGISYVPQSFSNFTMGGKLLRKGEPFRWEITKTSNGKFHTGRGYSDHLPIIATFSISPYSKAIEPEIKCISYKNKNLICGFESGFEGWIVSAPHIMISPTTETSFSGVQSLNIKGKVKRNRPIAKLSIRPKGIRPNFLSLKIKGAGKLSLSIKDKNGKTIYFCEPTFTKKIKSTRYTEIAYMKWQNIKLNLSGLNTKGKLDLIIKSYKEKNLNIYLDDISLN